MPFAIRNLAPRTLRFRLMVWNTAVVLLMVFPALALVREALRHVMWAEFDELLREDAEEVRLAVGQLGPDLAPVYQEMERKAQGHAHRGWFAQFYDAEGRLLHSCPARPPLDLPPAGPQLGIADAGPDRLARVLLAPAGRPALVVCVGASTAGVQEDIDLLTRMMVGAGALVLVLAPLGGYWLALRATRPVAALSDLAERLRPDSLGERLPLRQTGDELDRLSLTINGLLDRIATYVDQKRDFIANAAHELRSPLAAIGGAVEVALNSPRTPAEYADLLADVAEECDHLGALVNQLLLLAESDARRLALGGQARLDLVAAKSLAMFQGVAEADGVELTADLAPALVGGDEHHLRQVVNNLLDNALKFTPAGGRVGVAVAVDGRTAVLRVSDTGVGLAAEELSRIFERFYRADKSRPREGGRRGTGLGLSICQAVVAALGGTVAVESTPGRGSTFTVRLPWAGVAS